MPHGWTSGSASHSDREVARSRLSFLPQDRSHCAPAASVKRILVTCALSGLTIVGQMLGSSIRARVGRRNDPWPSLLLVERSTS